MKVVTVFKTSTKEAFKQEDCLKYLQQFRAISALEGYSTSESHGRMLEDLACGKISKNDYVKARMKL